MKKKKKKNQKVRLKKRWTTQDRSFLQWCRVRWTIGTGSGNQKRREKKPHIKQKVKNRDSLSRQALLRNECIPEQEPIEAIWYIKIVIFLYSVSVLFPFVEGYSRAQIFVFLFFFFNLFFFLFLGVNHFICLAPLWYCWTKKHVCEHIVIISVAFWMSIAL